MVKSLTVYMPERFPTECPHCGDTEGEWNQISDDTLKCAQCGERTNY